MDRFYCGMKKNLKKHTINMTLSLLIITIIQEDRAMKQQTDFQDKFSYKPSGCEYCTIFHIITASTFNPVYFYSLVLRAIASEVYLIVLS